MLNTKVENITVFEPYNEIYEVLKDYVESTYNNNHVGSKKVEVLKNKISQETPCVIFSEPINKLQTQSTTYDNTTRTLNYDINIYCNKNNNSEQIVRELAILVIEVMQGHYHMNGGVISIMPQFDSPLKDSYQANLRFTTNYIPSRSKLY